MSGRLGTRIVLVKMIFLRELVSEKPALFRPSIQYNDKSYCDRWLARLEKEQPLHAQMANVVAIFEGVAGSLY